jgi:hypothetical protein
MKEAAQPIIRSVRGASDKRRNMRRSQESVLRD